MSGVKQYVVTEPFLEAKCSLGEAPHWEESTNTLRFFDIIQEKLHTVDLDEGPSSHRITGLNTSIGTSGDIDRNEKEFIFAGKFGYGIYNRETQEQRYIAKFWLGAQDEAAKAKRMRSNDGAIDSHGRFWVGVMNDPLEQEPTSEGVIFRLDPDLSLHRMVEGVTIPNGICWTRDDKTMYMADSPTKHVYAYDFDAVAGSISDKRIFFKVDHPEGVPDGHCLDEEGFLWQAIYGAGKIVRLSPQGEVVAEISLPTRCVTCPCFAGEHLYVTSAEEEDPSKHPESTKWQGAVFKCHVGVKGLRPHKTSLRL